MTTGLLEVAANGVMTAGATANVTGLAFLTPTPSGAIDPTPIVRGFGTRTHVFLARLFHNLPLAQLERLVTKRTGLWMFRQVNVDRGIPRKITVVELGRCFANWSGDL